MATIEQLARDRYRQRVALARRVATEAAALWRSVNVADLDGSWAAVADRVFALVAGAQVLAAAGADQYVADVLDAQRIDPASDGRVNARSLAGVASDGRPLDTLLAEPLIAVKTLIGKGVTPARAMPTGLLHLDLITRTQIADAGRVADGVATTTRRKVQGYVRMLNPPACSRCVILAGRWYRYNQGFQRHPRCDCVHVPANEDRAGDLRTHPMAYFNGLSREQQEKVFTAAGARAIRDGADINQVVNAHRGISKLTPAGTTTEGMTRRGLAGQRLGGRDAQGRVRPTREPRLTPEAIYQSAETRDEAIRLLRLHGYIL